MAFLNYFNAVQKLAVSKKRPVLLVLAAIAVIAVAIGLAARPEPDSPGTTIANETGTAEAVPIIDVVSAPSAFPFMERWAAQYNDQGAGSINVGYMDGLGGDLAIVGNATADGRTYIPVSPQAVAIVYNIPSFPDIPSGLKLNSTVLSSIFGGNASKWSDASIRELNPDLNLPDEGIVVVHDIGNGSSLALIEKYLGSEVSWSNSSIAVPGPAELASMVRKTPYSVGYVDFSYAVQTKMTFAAIANSSGTGVVPSLDSIGTAVEEGMQVQNATGSPPFINASRLGNGSYPLVGLYYAAMADSADNATVDFVKWLVDGSGGQATLAEVQYPPLYAGNEELAAYVNRSRLGG